MRRGIRSSRVLVAVSPPVFRLFRPAGLPPARFALDDRRIAAPTDSGPGRAAVGASGAVLSGAVLAAGSIRGAGALVCRKPVS